MHFLCIYDSCDIAVVLVYGFLVNIVHVLCVYVSFGIALVLVHVSPCIYSACPMNIR